jgi:hypothetical protein
MSPARVEPSCTVVAALVDGLGVSGLLSCLQILGGLDL